MFRETMQIAERVEAVLATPLPALPGTPAALYTLARGSSDHAATVIHRLMAAAGIVATTLPPSLCASPLRLPDCALLAISQSGASPDLSQAAAAAVSADVPVIALVNAQPSALADVSTHAVAQGAGQEHAVAATKSVICSIVGGARLAERFGAPSFALDALPERIARAQRAPIDRLVSLFAADGPLLVIGRGGGLGVAAEIALKTQELLGRPAMAYSSAEVLHGPAGMITPDYPVLALVLGPEADTVRDSASRLASSGAAITLVHGDDTVDVLSATVALTHVYLALEAACRARGRSPDRPANLSKVTLTD